MDRVDDPVSLELDPHSIGPRTREGEIELNLRRAIRDERMRMYHIDEVVARGKHMAPGSQVVLQAISR